MVSGKVTWQHLRSLKKRGQKIAALTAYDYSMARLLDEAGVPLILVGDSLGMVTLGYPDTTHVKIEEMEHHTRAVARAKPNALLAADLPYHAYDSAESAVTNARRLVAAGAEAVKAEGGESIIPQVEAIVRAGIPFIGHLGMLPQHVLEEGGYKIKGKQQAERVQLLKDARLLQQAGAFAIVLELVTPPVAAELTASLEIPTIGIGSGQECDGQIVVINDLVGTFPWFTPRFIKPLVNCAEQMKQAVQTWQSSFNP